MTAIPTRRLGAHFEELRLQTEHHAQSKGRTPRVYLLLTGNVAMRRARAGFAFNFYGCAGYEIEEGQIIEGVQGNAEAAINSGADVIVLCAGDDDYAAQGAEITGAIKSLKAGVQVMVAGNPTDQIDALKAAGVDGFIHIKSNVLATLQETQRRLGVTV